MKRITYKALEADCTQLNAQMKDAGINWLLIPGQRNGYTAVDIATPEQRETGAVQRNLECGSPRECLAAAHQFVNQQYAKQGGMR